MPGHWRKHVPETLPKTRYSFFKENGKLRACIAAVEHDGFIYAAVSMCHPDDQFNKIIGKRIAEGKVHKCIALGYPVPREKMVILTIEDFVQHLKNLRVLEEVSFLGTRKTENYVESPVVEQIVDIFGYE